ncbi:MAG: DNA cytosine methyltransferase [Bacteroidota bacterium]|nr:DNA cytosine methyltransferase [Bacteroidota bacterium]MDP4231771.1 DNA cytosine methyltransferase [Bacteroidota bacterium]MDP4243507.1 DNA cytosine methyltransferase [Bacteroidota bacterium]MDP4287108.1 DNA cytosine methyltransferase [Bacteroidota bacterium]
MIRVTEFNSISLFSGAMGLDLGLEEAGISTRISQDYDKYCAETAKLNKRKMILGDIRDISGKDLCIAGGVRPKDVFLVAGGPPCQPFSTAGLRGSLNDPRGSLFMEFKRVIDEVRPRFFVMENVKGILSAPVIRENGFPTTAFEIIMEELEKLGYKLTHSIVDAVHYGVPQFRERLIVIGSRDNEPIFIPNPTHFQSHQNPDYRWQTLRNAISDLEANPGEGAKYSKERSMLLKLVPEGGNWKSLPKDIVAKAMGGAFESGGGKVGFYRRLSYDQPSPTLVTSPIHKSTMLTHPTARPPRPLSVSEYARIQQFPDSWKFAGESTQAYKQIGNAVPVGLGKAIGQMLISVATGTAKVHVKRARGTSVHHRMIPLAFSN